MRTFAICDLQFAIEEVEDRSAGAFENCKSQIGNRKSQLVAKPLQSQK